MRIWLQNNRGFIRLFCINTAVVFLGNFVLMAAISVIIYAFANRQLTREVDAANLRSVETALAAVDTVFRDTRSAAIRLALDHNINIITANPVHNRLDTEYMMMTAVALQDMRLSLRLNLDHSMFLHLYHSGYSICTRRGNGFAHRHPDRDVVERFNKWRENNPTGRYFTQFRYSYFDGNPVHLLTFYQNITGFYTGDSFIAINVDVNNLAGYLGGGSRDDLTRFIIINSEGTIILDTEGSMTREPITNLLQSGPEAGRLMSGPNGSMTVEMENGTMLLSWMSYPRENWTLMQFIPFDAYAESMNVLRRFIVISMVFGLMFSVIAALLITRRLFRPIANIIQIAKDPESYGGLHEYSGETKLLLMRVLESFQKNIMLEKEMLQKLTALRESRAAALQEQINPHFLYNTLHAINLLSISETELEESETAKAIVALAEIIRASMERTHNFTTVSEEVKHFEKYMEIACLRYGDDISYQCDIDPRALEMSILRLTLQPLAENAIRHGLQPRGGKGSIYVTISVTDDKLIVCVEDDGEGMSDQALSNYNRMFAFKSDDMYIKSHIGLLNICQRVKLIYGEQYGISVSRSKYGGLKVEVAMGLGGDKNIR